VCRIANFPEVAHPPYAPYAPHSKILITSDSTLFAFLHQGDITCRSTHSAEALLDRAKCSSVPSVVLQLLCPILTSSVSTYSTTDSSFTHIQKGLTTRHNFILTSMTHWWNSIPYNSTTYLTIIWLCCSPLMAHALGLVRLFTLQYRLCADNACCTRARVCGHPALNPGCLTVATWLELAHRLY
jgi:hypothetical protein